MKLDTKEIAKLQTKDEIVAPAKLEYKTKSIYIQALNMKNAERKVVKFLKENNIIE